MNMPSYNPSADYNYIHTLPRFAEEERALNAVDAELWPKIKDAAQNLLGPENRNADFLLSYNRSAFRQLPHIANSGRPLALEGNDESAWDPVALEEAVSGLKYSEAYAHRGNQAIVKHDQDELNRLLKTSGMRAILEERKSRCKKAQLTPDVNAVLTACAELAGRLPESKGKEAMAVLSKAVNASHDELIHRLDKQGWISSKALPEALNWRMRSRRLAHPVYDEDRGTHPQRANNYRLIPKTIFTEEELFGGALGRCWSHTPLDTAISQGFYSLHKLSKAQEIRLDNEQYSWKFWNDINTIRKMVSYLSSSARKKIDAIAAGEEGKSLREFLEIYSHSG